MKKILFLILLSASTIFAGMKLDYSSESRELSINIEEGDSIISFIVSVRISDGEGELGQAVSFADSDWQIPVGAVDGEEDRYRGLGETLFGNTAIAGPEEIIGGIPVTFLTSSMTVELVSHGVTINDTTIEDEVVLDTLQFDAPGDIVTLDLSVNSKSEGMGTVAYTGDLYKGEVITVTATPASGYRVKSWKGTDSKDPVKVQTVTLKKSKHKVSVQFEDIPDQEVSKATFKAGKVRGGSDDSFIIQGILGAGASTVPELEGSISVEIKSEEGTVLFTQTLDYADMDVKWPKSLSYVNKEAGNGELELFKYDILKGKFQMKASDQDLTGWSAPMTLTISVGDGNGYQAIILMNDSGDADVVNGKKYMPTLFLIGQEKSLIVDKEKVKENKDATQTGKISGRFSTSYDPAEHTLTSAEILFNYNENNKTADYDQKLILTMAGNGEKYSFKRSKDADTAVDLIDKATFDFKKATFEISFKNATFDIAEDILSIHFGWDETEEELNSSVLD